MEVLGYKYTVESEAIEARKECADYYGLPTAADNITKYYVDYYEAVDDNPIFWFIEFYEGVRPILGEPTTFNVEGEPVLIK